MRIVTNPGSNIPDALIRSYNITLAPQIISVDGVEHDTRGGTSLSQVDDWVKNAKTHPFVLGSSAAQLIEVFRDVARTDEQIVAVMSSRHVSGTHTAATAAGRLLRDKGYADVRVIDSGSSDLGTGFPTLLAAEASRVGMSLDAVVKIVNAFCEQAICAFIPEKLDWLVKAGRATGVKALIANLMSLRPVIGFEYGEAKTYGTVKCDERAMVDALIDNASKRVSPERPVWVGVYHGNAPGRAERLENAVRACFDVRYCLNRPLHASTYHSAGPGMIGLYVAPVDMLPSSIILGH